jgi:hypothetical protein
MMITLDRLEIVSKYFVQLMSSGYWILAALVMSMNAYGEMMLIYAGVTLIVNLFRIRSFDLFYWMRSSLKESTDSAFFRTFSYELELVLLLILIAVVFQFFDFGIFPAESNLVFGIFIAYCMGNMAGSVMAILREEEAIGVLLSGDLVSAVFWIAAIIILFLSPNILPIEVLLLGVISLVSRPVTLHILHFLRMPKRYFQRPVLVRRPEALFIAKSHIANVMKNNIVSIEVLLLGMVSNNQTVGLYRLARSALSMFLIGLNVSYQKILKVLGLQPQSASAKEVIIQKQKRFNWMVYFIGLPAGLVALSIFSMLKDDSDAAMLLITFTAVWASQFPTVMQQLPFAVAIIRAEYFRILIAWTLGITIITIFVLINESVGVIEFSLAILVGGLVRYVILIIQEGKMGVPFKIKLIRVAFQNYLKLILALLKRRPIVLNYQMGKVGSSSVAKYLRDNGHFEWHIHRFYDTPVAGPWPKKKLFKILDFAILWLVKLLAIRIYLVMGVRDPLSRDVSMFFQTAQNHYGINPAEANLEELYCIFIDKFPVGVVDNWFDDEIKRTFNIDVFTIPFNTKRGFVQFSSGRVNVFLYRLDKLDSLEGQLAEFFEEKDFKLIKINTNSNKDYAENYSAFKLYYFNRLTKKYKNFTKISSHFY